MVIVIFGAALLADGTPSPTLVRRVTAAYAFGGSDAIYMPTGGVARGGVTEAATMKRMLMASGVACDRIRVEPTATNTLSSALACALLLAAPDLAGHRIYAASSAYHLPRCRLLLRLAGVKAARCPPPAVRPEPYWMLREALALPWDAILLLLRRRSWRVIA